MELKQIQEVAGKYRKMLPDAEKINDERVYPRPLENFRHCAWMCDQIISGELDRDKAMRWLCFVQGCLWSWGITTVKDMKEDNRTPEIKTTCDECGIAGGHNQWCDANDERL